MFNQSITNKFIFNSNISPRVKCLQNILNTNTMSKNNLSAQHCSWKKSHLWQHYHNYPIFFFLDELVKQNRWAIFRNCTPKEEVAVKMTWFQRKRGSFNTHVGLLNSSYLQDPSICCTATSILLIRLTKTK